MKRICLDTSAYSHFKRGHSTATDIIRRARWIGVPAIVLGELHTGFALGSRRSDNETELQSFLDHPIVEVLVVDAATARLYAEIVVDLRRQGTPLPTNDLWIAALSAREGAPVLTADRHFRHISSVSARILVA